jgi:Tetratricopeptide repeat
VNRVLGIRAYFAAMRRLKPIPAKQRIEQLDRALLCDADAFDLRFERAGLLREQGRFDEAKQDYLELVRRRPTDFGVLNDFGTLALKAGFKDAALTLFNEAVRHHPENPMGRVNLANMLFLMDEQEQARQQLEAVLHLDPDHVHAHRGMCNLLAAAGDKVGARWHRDKGFRTRFLTTLPYRGDKMPVRVLLLVSAVGGNTPMTSFLDDQFFETHVLVTEYYDPKVPLPPHDVVFNSVGDADICREGLEAACMVVRRTQRPVINHPLAVLKTGRLSNVMRVCSVPNVVVPQMAAFKRRMLTGPSASAFVASGGFTFPLLLRAPGFHTGLHFFRVGDLRELVSAVERIPGDDVWLIEQLDARDVNGMYRKLRVMMIDGRLYPLHLAISKDWKVHYFRADMADSPKNRLVDGEFLSDMERAIGAPAVAALNRICATLDLDYAGIDFAVNAAGKVLFFEANATMVMAPLSADPKWDYRRPAFDSVFAAVRRMIVERSIQKSAATA